MTVVINHHLVLTKREWTAVINALDYMDEQLWGDEPTQDYVVDALKEVFPSDFIRETSEKIATSK
jgi:hypothetical protein